MSLQALRFGDGTRPDVLGVWEVAPSAADGEPALESLTMWHASLSTDTDVARTDIGRAETVLRATEPSIGAASLRLRRFAQHASETISFGTWDVEAPTSLTSDGPEANLLALLRMDQSRDVSAFDLGEAVGLSRANVAHQFNRFIRALRSAIANISCIVTSSGDQRIAQTMTGWTGDLRTAWAAELSTDAYDLHRRCVGLALDSRTAMIRTLALVIRGATLLMSSIFVGQIFAVPAVWRFLEDVREELVARRARGVPG